MAQMDTGMTTIERNAAPRGNTLFYTLAALGVWALSCYTTLAFINALMPGQAWAPILAILIQAAATGLESPVWRGKGGALNYIVLAVDVFVNVGGTAALAVNVDQTASYAAIANILGIGALAPGVEMLLAAGMGLLLAAGPEGLWNAGRVK